MNPVRADHKVLVLASDPLLAALVGGLVELTRLRAAFVENDERPEDALARVRPLAAVLMDALFNEAESDLFLARARRRRVQVLLFGSAESIGRRDAWAGQHHVPVFALPRDVNTLEAVLEKLLEPKGPARRVVQRRAHTERGADGTLILDDGMGTRWSVYDRRTTDRRTVIDRRFVNESGDVRHCDVSIEDADSLSVATLTKQLARATRIP